MCGLTSANWGLLLVEACLKASTSTRPDALGFLCTRISGKISYGFF